MSKSSWRWTTSLPVSWCRKMQSSSCSSLSSISIWFMENLLLLNTALFNFLASVSDASPWIPLAELGPATRPKFRCSFWMETKVSKRSLSASSDSILGLEDRITCSFTLQASASFSRPAQKGCKNFVNLSLLQFVYACRYKTHFFMKYSIGDTP